MKVIAHLNEELREEHGSRSFPVRKGDVVKVLRGSFSGNVGKVLEVRGRDGTLRVEDAERTKGDGSKVPAHIHASNVEIVELDLSDKWRKEILKRRSND